MKLQALIMAMVLGIAFAPALSVAGATQVGSNAQIVFYVA
jgi:hypothetical protein